jgi:hypothetical protein
MNINELMDEKKRQIINLIFFLWIFRLLITLGFIETKISDSFKKIDINFTISFNFHHKCFIFQTFEVFEVIFSSEIHLSSVISGSRNPNIFFYRNSIHWHFQIFLDSKINFCETR